MSRSGTSGRSSSRTVTVELVVAVGGEKDEVEECTSISILVTPTATIVLYFSLQNFASDIFPSRLKLSVLPRAVGVSLAFTVDCHSVLVSGLWAFVSSAGFRSTHVSLCLEVLDIVRFVARTKVSAMFWRVKDSGSTHFPEAILTAVQKPSV